MISAPALPDEALRLAALADLAVLDTEDEERFDRLTRLASRILQVPIALVSLIDADRQWLKSRVGIDTRETSRDLSFCGHAIAFDDIFEVPDASEDERFHDNPHVVGDPSIRFYAGRPLRAVGGERVGTLCVIDRVPRSLSADDRQVLEDLAALVERELQQQTLTEAWEANRALQARYQAIFENIHESISLIRPGEGWVMGNSASDRILGYPEGTTRLDNRESFVHPDDVERATSAVREFVEGVRGPDDPWLVRVAAADGRWHWFETAATDLRANPDVEGILLATRDVTERVQRSQQHDLIVEHSPLGIWIIDAEGTITYANERLAAQLGFEVDELIGTAAVDRYVDDERAGFLDRLAAKEPGKRFHTRDMRYVHRDGHTVVMEVTSCALFTPDGRFTGGMGMFRDRTRELELETVAATNERRYGLLFEHSMDVITVLGPDGSWRYSSPAGTRLLGYPPEHAPENGIFGLVHPDDVALADQALEDVRSGARGPGQPVTFRVFAADGSIRYLESSGVNLIDEPLIDGLMIVSRDVTERVRLTEALEHAAGHDPLTDLVNRGAFNDRLLDALARGERSGRRVAVAYVDLDRFKQVNDTFGHLVGDEVLCGVADRLRSVTRDGDVPSRMGGDEFVVLLEPTDDDGDVRAAVARIADELRRPHETSAGPIDCGASIGVAAARDGEDPSTLLARADVALYRAKASGRGCVVDADDDVGRAGEHE